MKNKTDRKRRLPLFIAAFAAASLILTLTALSWNTKTIKLGSAFEFTAAYIDGEFVLPDGGGYVFVPDEYGGLRPFDGAFDSINAGDRLYVKTSVTNFSNVPVYCRFKVPGEGENIAAAYNFLSGENAPETPLASPSGEGWYYL